MSKTSVLTIGINNYPGVGSDLRGCVNDARDMSRLHSPNRSSTPDAIDRSPFFHSADTLKILVDDQCKQKAVIQAVGTFLSDLNDGDFGFLWLSSHGSYVKDADGDEPDKTDEVIVCQDFGLWTDDKIKRLIEMRNPNSLLFLGTDACHSGTVHRLYIPENQPMPDKRVRFLPPDHFPEHAKVQKAPVRPPTPAIRIASQSALKNVIHFAGCQDTEFCYDASFQNKPNGAFTYYLLKALSTLKPGATFGEWFSVACRYLPSVEYPQKPRCNAKPGVLALPIPLRKG